MATPKLIQYLSTFSAQEVAAMQDFAGGDYFCPRKELRRLLHYLLEQWPDFPVPACGKARMYQVAYPDNAYDDKLLRYLLSDACRLVELFWGVARYQQDLQQRQLDLLKEFSMRDLHKMYESKCREAARQKTSRAFIEPEAYKSDYDWAAAEEDYFLRRRQRNFNFQIETASRALDRFYFFQQLAYACGMIERQNILEGVYVLPFTEHWLKHLEEKDFFNDAQISLYYSILLMQRHEDERYFNLLLDKIDAYAGQISAPVKRSAYLAAINFCARNIRRGLSTYVSSALDIYIKGLKDKALLENGELSPWTFNNVIKLALRMKRYDWTATFMQTYERYLPESFRQDALHYNRAELFYHTNRPEEAQEALLKVSYSDLNYYLGARVLLAKIYFEKQEIEPLISLLAAFTIFLKRNKEISEAIRQTYLNFCTFLLKITKRKTGKSHEIRNLIQSTQPLTDREWLLKIV